MIEPVSFFIPGPPIGKGRPRVTARGAFTPSKTREYEKHVRACGQAWILTRKDWQSECPSYDWFALVMTISFAQGRRPDVDNVIKSIMDGLEKVIWKNDSTVAPIVKQIDLNSPTPGVLVEIRKIELKKVKYFGCLMERYYDGHMAYPRMAIAHNSDLETYRTRSVR